MGESADKKYGKSRLIIGLTVGVLFLGTFAVWPFPGGRIWEEYWQKHREHVYVVQACSDENSCIPALLVSGPILPAMFAGHGYSIANTVEERLAQNPKVKTVCFDSPGGAVESGLALARLLERKGVDTCVTQLVRYQGQLSYITGACHSSCIIAFAAGVHRIAFQPDIGFMFHQDDKKGRFRKIISEYYSERGKSTHTEMGQLGAVVDANPFDTPELLSVEALYSTYGLVTEVKPLHVERNAPLCSALAACILHSGPECLREKSGLKIKLPQEGLYHGPSCRDQGRSCVSLSKQRG